LDANKEEKKPTSEEDPKELGEGGSWCPTAEKESTDPGLLVENCMILSCDEVVAS
jgi:hypothetical protein